MITEALPLDSRIEEHSMTNKDKVKNTAQVTKGKAKEATGKMTGSAKLKHDGKLDQVKGNVKQSGEKVKDAFRK
jgi:uncharacterized protein YjbJ (UPF0337 family)